MKDSTAKVLATEASASSCRRLDSARIETNLAALVRRIHERFPSSGLNEIAREFLTITSDSKQRVEFVSKPIIGLRIGIVAVLALIFFGLASAVQTFSVSGADVTLFELIQVLEAGINDMIFLGLLALFLFSLETRIKRHRALKALAELRSIAHVIDMHQLDKDPERLTHVHEQTASSPKVALTPFLMGRYLDYCSELCSLVGKVAALYVQGFDDGVTLGAVNEIENLTTGLSRKVWQKMIILQNQPDGQSKRP